MLRHSIIILFILYYIYQRIDLLLRCKLVLIHINICLVTSILQDYPTHLCTTLGFRGILSYTYINCNCKFMHMYIHKRLYTLNKLIIIIIIMKKYNKAYLILVDPGVCHWHPPHPMGQHPQWEILHPPLFKMRQM